ALPVYASSKSLVPLLTQGGLSHRDCLRVDAQSLQGVGSASRDARYKLITLGNGNERFHDLQDDPYEATNLLFGGLTAQEQDAFDVLSEGCTSITGIADRYPDEQVSIYPNPTTGTVRVEGITELQHIRITDLHGRVVLEALMQPGSGQLDLGQLAPGTYVLHGGTTRSRVVVR
ncbi:MAG: T9SS type A sorting domain-containing protein, partial [Flavobacteriales bacterium]|nr:T9SS type A sorting domain-containing protein [Flavobacteriales bacterium]